MGKQVKAANKDQRVLMVLDRYDGYDAGEVFERYANIRWWNVIRGVVYCFLDFPSVIRRLEQQQLIFSTLSFVPLRPPRTVYSLTNQGVKCKRELERKQRPRKKRH